MEFVSKWVWMVVIVASVCAVFHAAQGRTLGSRSASAESQSMSNSPEDASVDSEDASDNCVTQTCAVNPNILQTLMPAEFALINAALGTVNVNNLVTSTNALVGEANSLPATPTCFGGFLTMGNSLQITGQPGFQVLLSSNDGSQVGIPVTLADLTVQYRFMNLGSFGMLQIDFMLDNTGALVPGSEVFRFRTTSANGGQTTFAEAMAFDLVLSRLVSNTNAIFHSLL